MTTTIERLDALNIFPESGHCVYPIGHPGAANFQFCDARVAVPGSPYCHEHLQKCHISTGVKHVDADKAAPSPQGARP